MRAVARGPGHLQTVRAQRRLLHYSWPQEAEAASVRPSRAHATHDGTDVRTRKRELLLNEIRDQAERIKELMAELEEANKKVKQAERAHASNAPSPSSATDFSFISMSDSRLMSPEIEGSEAAGSPEATRARADVQDWIAKARESIQAFDGYLTIGGAGVRTTDLHAEEEGSDPENEYVGVQDEDYGDNDGDDGDEPSTSSDEAMRASRITISDDSAMRPKGQLATIPSPAAPFGLMAKLHLGSNRGLKKMKSKSSVGAEDDEEEDVGLANPDFFRPSEYYLR